MKEEPESKNTSQRLIRHTPRSMRKFHQKKMKEEKQSRNTLNLNSDDAFNDISRIELSPNKIEEEKLSQLDKSSFMSNNEMSEYFPQTENSRLSFKKEFKEELHRTFRVPTYLEKKDKCDFTNLRQVQSINGHNAPIWVSEINHTSQFLATGCNQGFLKIWKILDMEYDEEPYSLIEKKPYCVMKPESTENCAILDLSWCQKIPNYIVTAQFNKLAVLYDIEAPEAALRVFEHQDAVTCVSFHPDSDENECVFVTGCIDKTYQVWSKEKIDAECSQQAKDHVTAISISPDGVRVVIGLSSGQLVVCAFDNCKLNYITSIECKNRMGKYSKGTKVTSVVFLDNTDVLVTTNDSRMRIVNIEGRFIVSGTSQIKFKGHKNDNLQLKASCSEDMAHIICCSEDYYVYIWNRPIGQEELEKHQRNESCERFDPFAPEDIIPTTAQFCTLDIYKMFNNKYMLLGINKILKNIIIVTGFTGLINVYHNTLEEGE